MSGGHLRPLVLLESYASFSRNTRSLKGTDITAVMFSSNGPLGGAMASPKSIECALGFMLQLTKTARLSSSI